MLVQATGVAWIRRCWIGELQYAPTFGRYYIFFAWSLKFLSIAGFVKRENNCLTNTIGNSEFASWGTKQRTSWPFSITSCSSRTNNLLFETQWSIRLFIYIKTEDSIGNIQLRASVAQNMNWNSYDSTNCSMKKRSSRYTLKIMSKSTTHESDKLLFRWYGYQNLKVWVGGWSFFRAERAKTYFQNKALMFWKIRIIRRHFPLGGQALFVRNRSDRRGLYIEMNEIHSQNIRAFTIHGTKNNMWKPGVAKHKSIFNPWHEE